MLLQRRREKTPHVSAMRQKWAPAAQAVFAPLLRLDSSKAAEVVT